MGNSQHVAIIMDGAGRWAVARGLERHEGHVAGIETAHEVLVAADDASVTHLTLFTFSLANWERPRAEVKALMELLVSFATRLRKTCIERSIQVGVIGQLDELQTDARRAFEGLVRDTKTGSRMTLTFALSYGGRSDIATATRSLAARARAGLVLPEEIDVSFLHREMTTRDLPPVDILIRTGGERRLSDFLLYECANAEIVFLNEMWPEFTPSRLRDVLTECQRAHSAPPPASGFDMPTSPGTQTAKPETS